MLAFAPYLLLLTASFVPRVEDPLPEAIGLEFLFALAGGFGALAGFVHMGSSRDRRERAMSRAGFAGFCFGVVVYLVALVVQLSSA
jgi:hypothetical protein